MTAAQTTKATRKRKPQGEVKIRKPRSRTVENILTLAITTPATPTEIAQSVNTTKQNVSQVLIRYGIDANSLQSFKENRADIFAGFQEKLLNSIDADDIKKAPVGSRVLALAQIYDKERLERGQTTNIQGVIHADIAEIRRLKSVDNHENVVDNHDNNIHNTRDSVIIDV